MNGVCNHCNTVFKALGCYYHHCPCHEAHPSLTDVEIERGVKKRQQDEICREYTWQKEYQNFELVGCEWWCFYKTDASVKSHFRENFLYKRSLSEERPMQEIIDRKLFGYVQCDFEVIQRLRRYFWNYFPPIMKINVVTKEDIGTLMKEYLEEEFFMVQPRRMLISSFHSTRGTFITFFVLLETWAGVQESSSARSILSQKRFQHLRIFFQENTTSKRWNTKLKCWCWNYETVS